MKRNRPDHYTDRAKKSGYPARSVYKLEEIQKKHTVLHAGDTVLDIGAAPGSWSMYASEQSGPQGRVVGVDLKECSIPGGYKNVEVFTGDAFSPEIADKLAARGPYDVVLSDAAPATTGNRTVDTARSAGLAEECIAAARQLLQPGGNLVIKLFQGGEEQQILQLLRKMFKSAKPFKPKSSRKDSFEIFMVAIGFKGGTDEQG
ncbi:MAG: RlmE family RNA methyltransferase [Spirochaetota bacterium]